MIPYVNQAYKLRPENLPTKIGGCLTLMAKSDYSLCIPIMEIKCTDKLNSVQEIAQTQEIKSTK